MRGAGHGFLTHPFIHLRPKAEKVCNPYTGIWFHRSTRTKLVDSTTGCEMLSFLDAYSGYQQVYMAEEDKEKTSLIAPSFCYKRMPFGLINAGATFKRLMSLILRSQLGRNAEVYVDDAVIKSRLAGTHPKNTSFFASAEQNQLPDPTSKLYALLRPCSHLWVGRTISRNSCWLTILSRRKLFS